MREYKGETYKIDWSLYYKAYQRNPSGFGDWRFRIGWKLLQVRGMWWTARHKAIEQAAASNVYSIFLLP